MSSAARGRGGSKGRSYQGSAARVFAACSRFSAADYGNDHMTMEWTATAYQYNTNVPVSGPTTYSYINQGPVDIVMGPFFGLHMLGPIGNFNGHAEIAPALTRHYNGAIDPINDVVSDYTPITDLINDNINWRGHASFAGTTQKDSYQVTGSSVIFRGYYVLQPQHNTGSHSTPTGSLVYAHPQFENFTGSNWVPSFTLEWISLYFNNIPSFTIVRPPGIPPFTTSIAIIEFSVEIGI